MRKGLRILLFSFIVLIVATFQFSILIINFLFPIVSRAALAQKNAVRLILKNDKTFEDIVYIKKFIAISQKQTFHSAKLANKVSVIFPKSLVVELANILESMSTQLPLLLGDGKDANFVLLFLNNYELRPGGGFIGSLGFITFQNYTMTKFEVQDVYEIDGQIVTHSEPHYAVRKYLNQPNEFLRDSNFSPDFRTNAKKTIGYLSSVPAYNKSYAAVIAITTTAFEDLLLLTGPIELTDHSTIITSSNFFATTQRKIETEFFPGSKLKRSILQSLGNVMRHRIEEIPPLGTFNYLFKAVKTKNLVFFTSNHQLQNLFAMLNATGSNTPAYKNWILPVDANVGVNKMDALIRKTMDIQLSHSSGALVHTFKSTYTNTITADATEKESYKNYFQLYVPAEAVLRKAVLNGLDVGSEIIIAKENGSTVFALYFETPPANSTTVSMTYDIPYNSKMKRLHFLKQIGSKPSPLTVIYRGEITKVKQQLFDSDEVFNLY